MKRLLAILFVFAYALNSSHARLNETEQQSEARYGKPRRIAEKPTPGSDKTVYYAKEHISITAEFVKGRCQQIEYAGLEGQKDLTVILEAEGGPIWTYHGDRTLVRSDGLAIAQIRRDWPPAITFTENVWEKAHQQAIKDAETAKKKAEAEAAKKFKKGF